MQSSDSSVINSAAKQDASMRKIAYSMDLLIPGIYFWWGQLHLSIGGEMPEDSPERYPGMIHSQSGLAIVFPGYHIWTTYQDSYNPR
ncbi:MAG: hypothetical protein WBB82_04705 [Limnothrix sp.]